jgi:hypothetical protein
LDADRGTGDPGTGSREWRSWLATQAPASFENFPISRITPTPFENERCAISPFISFGCRSHFAAHRLLRRINSITRPNSPGFVGYPHPPSPSPQAVEGGSDADGRYKQVVERSFVALPPRRPRRGKGGTRSPVLCPIHWILPGSRFPVPQFSAPFIHPSRFPVPGSPVLCHRYPFDEGRGSCSSAAHATHSPRDIGNGGDPGSGRL